MGQKGLISFDKVTKRFGKRNVIDDLSLDIDEGEFFGIVGVSGSGKTTLLKMLIGFWKPKKGSIVFDSHNIWKRQGYVSRFFGFSSQEDSTYDTLTVMENLRYFGKLYNMPRKEIASRSKELLDLVELSGSRGALARELSTGMRRRLDIACALMHNPEVLILDEPTKDLDPFLRKEILAMLRKVNKAGTTIVMTSHLLEEIEMMCDRIAILHNGHIECCDTPLNLKGKYSDYEELQLKTYPGDYEKLAERMKGLSLNKVIVKPDGIVAYADRAESVLTELCGIARDNDEHILELRLSKPSMEEVFEAVTRR